VTEFTISTVTITWKCPVINPVLHSEVLQFYLDCLPADTTAEQEGYLTPVPTSPALPPPVFAVNSVDSITARVQYIYQKYTDVEVTTVIFSNLTPATAYRIRGKCRSLSGWSHLSTPVVQQTLAYVPDPPDPVDICKISTNGLLLSWRAPRTDNGQAIDYYQIELMDAKMAEPIIEDETASQKGESVSTRPAVTFSPSVGPASAPLLSQQSTNIHAKRLPTGGPKTSVASRFHRLIKHKNLQFLHK
jgi:hypothetical protein